MLAFLALIVLGGSPALAAPQQAKPNRAKAIQEGLVWLARHQNDNGSWGGNTLMQHCKGDRPCYQGLELIGYADTGLAGLALLAFLRNGCDPLSKQVLTDPVSNTKYVAGDVITRGLSWLVKVQQKDGGFMQEDGPAFLYNQALAEMAMAEASLRDKANEDWRAAARKGLDWLENAQRKSPDDKGLWGWRYFSRVEIEKDKKTKPEVLHDSDVSATGWAVAALSAASRAGLEVHKESLAGALEFMNSVCVTNGRVGYQTAEQAGLKLQGRDEEYEYHFGTLCALGILIRLDTTKDSTNSFLDAAAKHIVEDQPRAADSNLAIDYYYWYHGTEALNRLEGTEYAKGKKRKLVEPWNKSVTERLCALQDHAKGACSSGGWVTRDRWSYAGGPVYTTAMALLTLDLTDRK
jgi:hypothetical protein